MPPLALALVVNVIVRNLVPIIGLVFLHWSPGQLILLYFADTLFTIAALIAALAMYFLPPDPSEGWAARLNALAGPFIAAGFLTLFMAVPLGVPVIFMLADTGFSLGETLANPGFQSGLAAQFLAALISFRDLHAAMRTHTPEAIGLKKRFGLVFLRWVALMMVTYTGLPMLLGRFGPYLLVLFYSVVLTYTELLPDHFLRSFGGFDDDGLPRQGRAPGPAAGGANPPRDATGGSAGMRRNRSRHQRH
jgi:hypothetical protein